MGRHWPKALIAAVVLLVAGVTVGVVVYALSHEGGGDGSREPASRPSVTPTPTGPDRVGPAPSTIPAVRHWRAERGPGWRPDERARIVADPGGPLVDEARLLAGELSVDSASTRAGLGDVVLELDRKADIAPEGYELTCRNGMIRIVGSSEAGVFYGTRTLLQTVRAQGRFADGVVRDRPAREQRGLMLDIARKHFSAGWIRARVREMSDLKLNQLQLHLSDDQAFRVESDSHPEVVSDPHLTKRQVREIVRLAASRHITVIPEIDSPGHLGAVLRAHPDLRLRNARGEVVEGAVDIADPKAARLVDDLLKEYADLFPGAYWHLGGDEYGALLAQDPESTYPALASAARRRYGPGAGVQDLAAGWLNDRARTVRAEDRTPQVWNDGMHRGGAVRPMRPRQVAYWTGKEIGARPPEEYLREGWKLVNLNDEYLYYVLGEPHDFRYPTGERLYREWTPAVLRGSAPVPAALAGPDRVLGGRFAVWCDRADAQTPAQVARGIRLPLAAFAQKVWDARAPRLEWREFASLVGRTD